MNHNKSRSCYSSCFSMFLPNLFFHVFSIQFSSQVPGVVFAKAHHLGKAKSLTPELQVDLLSVSFPENHMTQRSSKSKFWKNVCIIFSQSVGHFLFFLCLAPFLKSIWAILGHTQRLHHWQAKNGHVKFLRSVTVTATYDILTKHRNIQKSFKTSRCFHPNSLLLAGVAHTNRQSGLGKAFIEAPSIKLHLGELHRRHGNLGFSLQSTKTKAPILLSKNDLNICWTRGYINMCPKPTSIGIY